MAREYLISKYEENEKNHSWLGLFQSIDNSSSRQERVLKLTTRVAHMWQNACKNRYRNVSTYDSCRVVLKKTKDDQSDYINASPLCVPQAKRNYILTQGPLSSTCNDFWQMVWEQDSKLIVMLNRLVERNCEKCHEYFPTEKFPEVEFETFSVRLKSEERSEHYVVRTLELTAKEERMLEGCSGGSSRNVLHFQFISWPDFGVPHCSHVFLEFLERVRATGLLDEPAPAVVHCSAGIGRSGTFAVVDTVLSMIEEKVSVIDLEELVVKMRRYRMGLIQTPQQLQFCWKTIADALRSSSAKVSDDASMEEEPKFRAEESVTHPIAVVAGVVASRVGDAPPLDRSAANQMTSGQHAKSLTDLSVIRKRSLGETFESDEDAKHARRDSGGSALSKCERAFARVSAHESVRASRSLPLPSAARVRRSPRPSSPTISTKRTESSTDSDDHTDDERTSQLADGHHTDDERTRQLADGHKSLNDPCDRPNGDA